MILRWSHNIYDIEAIKAMSNDKSKKNRETAESLSKKLKTVNTLDYLSKFMLAFFVIVPVGILIQMNIGKGAKPSSNDAVMILSFSGISFLIILIMVLIKGALLGDIQVAVEKYKTSKKKK